MKRIDVNYVIDVAMAVAFLISFTTGLIKFPSVLKYVLQVYGGLPIYRLNWIHDYSGLTFGILGVTHLVLHWDWLVSMTRRKLGTSAKKDEGETGKECPV